MDPPSYRHIRQKKAETNAKLPQEWLIPEPPAELRDVTEYARQFSSPVEIAVTESTAHELVGKLAYGKCSSLEVARAFCHRAAVAHQLIFFDKAFKRGQELDGYFHEHKKVSGTLHGLPVSLKDSVGVGGGQTTIGYGGWLGKEDTAEDEALVAEILRDARAVFYVKTSTVNNIVGLLSAGGSSGGEGALIALQGSPMGVGTDIAGSIRIPAGANGIFGLKPSCDRLPYKNLAQSMDGQETIGAVIGPMTNSIADARLFMQTVLEAEPWKNDPGVSELKWRPAEEDETREQAKSGLSFAVMKNDGEVTPHPPILQGLDITVAKLRAQGHEWEALSADAGADIHRNHALSGEPVLPQIAVSYGSALGTLSEKSITSLWELHTRKLKYQEAYQSASYAPEKFCYLGYGGFVNFLDYTASVVPVEDVKVDRGVDGSVVGYVPGEGVDGFVYESYDPEVYHGAPVSIQIVGRRLQEEKVHVISEVVEAALKA
ncbi:amidase signature enzyme [Choiromyces venosus 120613-1]|uniref:amidase n=1 Tax=Choiromyces venosus 120613-1 TaxID=1336337 RepID=A0A3N4IUQ7_9PEZI|nr:amidase signature enzyme [Choiromyces venosus 120613-1]